MKTWLSIRPTPEEFEVARQAIQQQASLKLKELLVADFKVDLGDEGYPSGSDWFICRYCGWEFEQRMNGIFPLHLNTSPVQNVVRRMKQHLRGCKTYKRRKNK